MNKNLDLVAKELYSKIYSYPNLVMRDSEGNDIESSQVEGARKFTFDFENKGQNLAAITISLNDTEDENRESFEVLISNDPSTKKDEFVKKLFLRFAKEMREFAKQHMLTFNVHVATRSNKERDAGESIMSESKLFGTAKTSYQRIGEATLIIKHHDFVNQETPAGRTQRIESIYVENSEGERFKYPYKHLNGARALAQHVSHGGNPYDSVGKYMIGLSEELGRLRMFKNYVERNDTISEAMGAITTKVFERIDSIKKEINQLQRPTVYTEFLESFTEQQSIEIPEEVMNDWIDRLTIRTFNEELTNVFPYIFKLVSENDIPVKELAVEDLFGEESNDDVAGMVQDIIQDILKGARQGLDMTDHIADELGDHFDAVQDSGNDALQRAYSMVRDAADLDPEEQAQAARSALEMLLGKDSNETIIPEFAEYEQYLNQIVEGEQEGIFSPENEDAIAELNQLLETPIPLGLDGTNVVQSLEGLGFDSDFLDGLREMAQNETSQEMDARPFIKEYIKEKDEEMGTDILSQLNFGEEEMPEPQLTPEPETGMQPAPEPEPGVNPNATPSPEMGMNPAAKPAPIAESAGNMFNELKEFILSMYNDDEGNFPKGTEGVKIACEKKFGERVGPIAAKIVERMTTIGEMKRIKQLAGLNEFSNFDGMLDKMMKSSDATSNRNFSSNIDGNQDTSKAGYDAAMSKFKDITRGMGYDIDDNDPINSFGNSIQKRALDMQKGILDKYMAKQGMKPTSPTGNTAKPTRSAPTGTQVSTDDDGNHTITTPDGKSFVVGPDGKPLPNGGRIQPSAPTASQKVDPDQFDRDDAEMGAAMRSMSGSSKPTPANSEPGTTPFDLANMEPQGEKDPVKVLKTMKDPKTMSDQEAKSELQRLKDLAGLVK